ncbi:MAG: hypothetical protein JXB88_07185 [Spirochaetales bacterium]|nr:hypothetical protein [Spirochaetales bacterium]
MNELYYTLIADGSSDKALIPIINWLLRECGLAYTIQPVWADLRHIYRPLKDLADKIIKSYELYPCDILFIHRDAEKKSREHRVGEINIATQQVKKQLNPPPYISVIPVKMTETWLLIDEAAIKRASGNPNSKEKIELPKINKLELLPDPKEILYNLLKKVCGLKGRRLKQFSSYKHASRVSEFISDFTPLKSLHAFSLLELEIKEYIKMMKIGKNLFKY